MKITREIVQVLRMNNKIENVYFMESGEFCFVAHSLPEHKDSKELKLYGQGQTIGKKVIAGEWNVDKIKEPIEIGVPSTLIVKTVTRAEALATDLSETSEFINTVTAMSADERKKLKALLFGEDREEEEVAPTVKKSTIKTK
jgi:hypothetical protein